MSFYTQKGKHTMRTISENMMSILEKLAEMFPTQTYQSKLENYLSSKHITDPAQLEYYMKNFERIKE